MTGDSMSAVLGAAAAYVDAAADGAARALTVVVGSVAGRRFFRRRPSPLEGSVGRSLGNVLSR